MSPRLSDELERNASRYDDLGGRDLGLDQVLGRARGIRRRRRGTAAVAVAAVVAAIGVPTALTLRSHDATVDPAHFLPTIDRIGLGVLPVGDQPKTGWLQGGTWHTPDGDRLTVSEAVHEVARLGDGVVAVRSDRAGDSTAIAVRGDGRVDELGPISGGLATSARGGVVAFVNPGGDGAGASVTAVQDGSETTEVTLEGLPDLGPSSSYDAVAVTGEDCREGHPCAVWANDRGATPRVSVAVTPGMDLGAPTGLELLADVTSDGVVAGYTRVFDGGSCSRVQDGANTPLWHTCDARFLSFSPRGEELLGSSAYADGFGDTELKTFDARTGDPGLDLRTSEGATITQMRWEDDDHLLAVVDEGNRWGVLRIGLDRTVEYAVAPVAGSNDTSPFLLPE